MMRKVFLLTILLISGRILYSQVQEKIVDARPLNSINLNLFGDASIISLNYERQFLVSPNFILSSKLGLGYNTEFQICFGPCSPPEKYLTIPHHFTGNIGKKNGKHFFEIGLGGTIMNGNTMQSYILYSIVGYRFLPLKSNKINFRIILQIPFSGNESVDNLFSPIGLNFGVSF